MAGPEQFQTPRVPVEQLPAQFGRYLLREHIGQGGMGDVYLATFSGGIAGVEKICVVKRLRRAVMEDRDFVDRFLDEARLVVQLNHANMVPVFDAGTIDGDYFLAMEYVEGVSARALIEAALGRWERLSPALCLYITREVLAGLAYAHRKTNAAGQSLNLVHRDISPQNVLCSTAGEVKLIDFGLAKSAENLKHTEPMVVLGKYAYMSPEQARALPVDRRSDLYAVGLLLFELLTGRKVFDGASVGVVMDQLAKHKIVTPAQVIPDVDPEIEAMVERALRMDPALRFQTAEEFRDAVSRALLRMAPTFNADNLAADVERARRHSMANEDTLNLPADEVKATISKMEAAQRQAPPPPEPPPAPQAPEASADPTPEESALPPPTVPAAPSLAAWKLVALGVFIGGMTVAGAGGALLLLTHGKDAAPGTPVVAAVDAGLPAALPVPVDAGVADAAVPDAALPDAATADAAVPEPADKPADKNAKAKGKNRKAKPRGKK